VADLDSREFAKREKAGQELCKRGADAVPVLREVLRAGPSLEVTRRIEALLDKPDLRNWPADTVRDIRAIHTLEQMGTEAALRHLESKEAIELVFIHPPTPSVNTNANLEYHEYQSVTHWRRRTYWYSLMTPHP